MSVSGHPFENASDAGKERARHDWFLFLLADEEKSTLEVYESGGLPFRLAEDMLTACS